MPSKTILSPAQRSAIFDPPADQATIERLYTLGPDDLGQVARRRRGPNRLGYAVQLCYLNHPGRSLLPGEAVPAAMLSLLADQIGCRTDDFADYSARATTLREHRAEIEAQLGLRAFDRIDVRSMLALGSEIATSTDRGEAIVCGMVDRLRLDRIVLPAASTLERLALIVRAQARKAAHAGLIRDCPANQESALERLITSDENGRTRLGWIREWPEAPSASNLKGIVERLDTVRGIGIAADRARRIHAARYAVIARTAGIVTAQHLRRLERPRRLAMLVAAMIEMEAALTDAALVMVEKMVGALFRRADRTRSDRLLGQAKMLKDTARFHARLGRLLVDARATGRDAIRRIEDKVGWDQLERSIRFAEDLTRSADDGLEEVIERYPTVRRFAPTFLAAFTFRTARTGDPLFGAIEALRTMYRDGRSVLPKRVPTSFKPRWRKIVQPIEGTIDRRAYEIAVIVHLRERLGSGSIWVDGSRAYRTLDDYLLPTSAFDTMRADDNLRLAVPPGFTEWYEHRRTLLTRRMTEVERAAAAGELIDVTIERGQLLISPIRRTPSDDVEALKARLYAMLPRVRITDLLVEVAAWSGFADQFVHARSGEPASDQSALMGAVLADAINLGLGRMAESSRGLTLSRLRWTAEWHVRDETYLSALAAIVDCHTAHPLAQVWGPGDTSSSDGQFFRAGGQGEARADRNARYGTDPGVLFYTHVTDRFTPFHTKVIAANAGEAAHVLDGLLDHESELVIREHATDTAGAVVMWTAWRRGGGPVLDRLGIDLGIDRLADEGAALGFDRSSIRLSMTWMLPRIAMHEGVRSPDLLRPEHIDRLLAAVRDFAAHPDLPLFFGARERYGPRFAKSWITHASQLGTILYHRGQSSRQPRKSMPAYASHPLLPSAMWALVQRWLAARAPRLRPATVYHHEIALRRFLEHLGRVAPEVSHFEEVTREHVESFFHTMADEPSAGSGVPLSLVTRRNRTNSLALFFRDTVAWDWEGAPQRQLVDCRDKPRHLERVPRYIPEDELARVMDGIRALACPRQRAALLTLRWSGARRGEVRRLALDCLDRYPDGTARLRIPVGKTGRERMVPLHEEAADALRAVTEARRGACDRAMVDERTGDRLRFLFIDHGKLLSEFYLFETPLGEACRAVGLVDARGRHTVTAHRFRHTLGTQLAERGARLDTIMSVLGHESPAMSMVYARISDPEVLRDYRAVLGPGAVIAGPGAEAVRAGRLTAGAVDWLRSNFLKTELELGHCLRLPEEGPCECDLYLSCSRFVTTPAYAPRLRERRSVELRLIDDARERSWEREVERHEGVVRRIDTLLADLTRSFPGTP